MNAENLDEKFGDAASVRVTLAAGTRPCDDLLMSSCTSSNMAHGTGSNQQVSAMNFELFNQMMQKAGEENGEGAHEVVGGDEITLLAWGLSADYCVCW